VSAVCSLLTVCCRLESVLHVDLRLFCVSGWGSAAARAVVFAEERWEVLALRGQRRTPPSSCFDGQTNAQTGILLVAHHLTHIGFALNAQIADSWMSFECWDPLGLS